MSNWDDDDDWEGAPAPGPVGVAPSNDLGDWDDEDAEEVEEAPIKKAPAAMKPKTVLARALKAREEEERKREQERILALEKELAELNPSQRKLRQQEMVEEADLENAKDLFADVSVKDSMKPPADPTLETFQPKTDADFEKFAKMIGKRVRVFNDNPRKTGQYVQLLKHVFRDVITDLGPEDTKDLSTFMGLLSNEKRDEFKKAKGGKKKAPSKKVHVRVDRASDIRGDAYDDFADDFM